MPKKPRRKSDAARRANQIIRSRTVLMMVLLGVVTFALLFFKLYDLQINRHSELQSKAVKQQTHSTVVTASRGTIYDRSGIALAISATAETIFVSPAEIAENEFEEVDGKKVPKQDKVMVARGLSRIVGVPQEKILERMNKTWRQNEEIKKRSEKAVSDEVRRFINGEIDAEGNPVEEKDRVRIHGVYLSDDSKRYYPYSTLASHVIGFVNSENNGAYGLESKYENELQGTSGLTITAKNARGTELLYQYEQYYDAKDGDNLVLTTDIDVQYSLEKGLESMVAKFGAKNGATGIVMDVKTGALLAMASYPTYDLNSPNVIYDKVMVENLAKLDPNSEAYTSALEAAQYKQWRNKCINDTYEPGSTFKPVTLAAALEEGLVNKSSTFNCSGSVMVPGWKKAFGCSKRIGHGHQTLIQATGGSCNPAFISMGLKIGTQKYYQYLKSFGLMEPTGVDMVGETTGIFASEKDFSSNVVSLASYAFGQTFTVTPLQVIRAQAACINGGYLNTPYVVEQVLDDAGNIVAQHDPTPVRQVISEETSAVVRECLEYVVASGTGKNGQVVGYRIGGKTGTADKTGDKNKDVVVSFMSFAPADDPQVIMLLTMDSPSRTTGTYVSGGNMVGPTASRIMGEILPDLGIEPDYTSAQSLGADATVANVVGSTLAQAKERLSASGFGCKIVGSGTTVTDQTPAGGAIIPNNANVIVYMGAEKPSSLCQVPTVVGMTAAEANKTMTNAGLIMRVSGTTAAGSGNVHAISQREAPGTKLEAGTVVTVQFGDSSVLD